MDHEAIWKEASAAALEAVKAKFRLRVRGCEPDSSRADAPPQEAVVHPVTKVGAEERTADDPGEGDGADNALARR